MLLLYPVSPTNEKNTQSLSILEGSSKIKKPDLVAERFNQFFKVAPLSVIAKIRNINRTQRVNSVINIKDSIFIKDFTESEILDIINDSPSTYFSN